MNTKETPLPSGYNVMMGFTVARQLLFVSLFLHALGAFADDIEKTRMKLQSSEPNLIAEGLREFQELEAVPPQLRPSIEMGIVTLLRDSILDNEGLNQRLLAIEIADKLKIKTPAATQVIASQLNIKLPRRQREALSHMKDQVTGRAALALESLAPTDPTTITIISKNPNPYWSYHWRDDDGTVRIISHPSKSSIWLKIGANSPQVAKQLATELVNFPGGDLAPVTEVMKELRQADQLDETTWKIVDEVLADPLMQRMAERDWPEALKTRIPEVDSEIAYQPDRAAALLINHRGNHRIVNAVLVRINDSDIGDATQDRLRASVREPLISILRRKNRTWKDADRTCMAINTLVRLGITGSEIETLLAELLNKGISLGVPYNHRQAIRATSLRALGKMHGKQPLSATTLTKVATVPERSWATFHDRMKFLQEIKLSEPAAQEAIVKFLDSREKNRVEVALKTLAELPIQDERIKEKIRLALRDQTRLQTAQEIVPSLVRALNLTLEGGGYHLDSPVFHRTDKIARYLERHPDDQVFLAKVAHNVAYHRRPKVPGEIITAELQGLFGGPLDQVDILGSGVDPEEVEKVADLGEQLARENLRPILRDALLNYLRNPRLNTQQDVSNLTLVLETVDRLGLYDDPEILERIVHWSRPQAFSRFSRLVEWFRDSNEPRLVVRRVAIAIIGASGTDDVNAQMRVVEALSDRTQYVREAAARALDTLEITDHNVLAAINSKMRRNKTRILVTQIAPSLITKCSEALSQLGRRSPPQGD